MDFREYEVTQEGDEIVIVGTIRDPVNWDFTIRVCEDDLAGITRLATRKNTVGLVLRSLFKRRKHDHWSQDHEEHIAEGKRRLDTAREKAAERAAGSGEALAARRGSPVRAGRTSAPSGA
jgi:hypothetical protein